HTGRGRLMIWVDPPDLGAAPLARCGTRPVQPAPARGAASVLRAGRLDPSLSPERGVRVGRAQPVPTDLGGTGPARTLPVPVPRRADHQRCKARPPARSSLSGPGGRLVGAARA